MSTAFQSSAFQGSAFQIDAAIPILEEVMRTILLSDATVAGLLADRMMPDISLAELSTMPIVVYSRLNSGEEYDLEGNPFVEISRLEYSCLDKTYLGARQLLEAVRAKAIASRGTFSGIKIDSVFVADIRGQAFSKLTNCYQIDLDLEVHRIL